MATRWTESNLFHERLIFLEALRKHAEVLIAAGRRRTEDGDGHLRQAGLVLRETGAALAPVEARTTKTSRWVAWRLTMPVPGGRAAATAASFGAHATRWRAIGSSGAMAFTRCVALSR